jgi:hypothetical protein
MNQLPQHKPLQADRGFGNNLRQACFEITHHFANICICIVYIKFHVITFLKIIDLMRIIMICVLPPNI